MTSNARVQFVSPALLFLLSVISRPLVAQELTAADLYPHTTVLYAQVLGIKQSIELIKDHPLRTKVAQIDAVKKAIKGPDVVKFQIALGLFEGHMGTPWDEALSNIADGGAYIGFDAQSNAPALLVKARDIETLIKLRQALFQVVQGGKPNGQDPIKKVEYRGINAYEFNNLKIAALDSWLLVTDKNELGKRIIDQFLDRGDKSLANNRSFQVAKQRRDQAAQAWAFADVEAIRMSGKAKELYQGKTDNILAEMLFGGIVTSLQHTDSATAALSFDKAQVRLSVMTPFQSKWITDSREYYFGSDMGGQAPPLLKLPTSIFSLSAYRDLSQMWLRAPDLMTDKANDQLAQADSQLTTFFSGKDFGEDILGSFKPELQFVVTRQDPESLKPTPTIKLPAFAIIANMKNPEATKPDFRRVFLSFVGFLNVVGAMNGQPQLDLAMETKNNNPIVSASYVVPPGKDPQEGPINYNFSPTMTFVGERFILASARPLAEQLMDTPKMDATKSSPANTEGELNAILLSQVLDDNRDQLIAQNMLEKGHSKEAAEQEIAVLMNLLNMFQGGRLQLTSPSEGLQLDVRLRFAE
jgi:hypothetical protein